MAFDCIPDEPVDPDRALILKARDRVARGWCQRAMHNGHGVCLLGALLCALHDSDVPTTVHSFKDEANMERLVRKMGFANCGDAIRFNDNFSTSQRDVLERFDAYLQGRMPVPVKPRFDRLFVSMPMDKCGCPACKAAKGPDMMELVAAMAASDAFKQTEALLAKYEKEMLYT